MSKRKVNRKLIDKCRRIAKKYGMKASFKCIEDLEDVNGGAIPMDKWFQVSYHKNTKRGVFLSIFFHELTHCLNFINKKYLAYHSIGSQLDELPKEQARLILRTGLRAERYTDKEAAKLMLKLFPRFKYQAYYDDPGTQLWHRIMVNEVLKEYLLTFKK